MTSSKANLRISSIEDHNYDRPTDKLYDPLRTVVMHPETAAKHEMSSPRAAEKTLMLDHYQKLTPV